MENCVSNRCKIEDKVFESFLVQKMDTNVGNGVWVKSMVFLRRGTSNRIAGLGQSSVRSGRDQESVVGRRGNRGGLGGHTHIRR